jgi:HTH-type transcriptional regulator/antitoxin HipB
LLPIGYFSLELSHLFLHVTDQEHMKIQDAQSLGQAIRLQRQRLKVTQRDLAMTSGTGLRFIIDLEKGKATCQLGKALEVARTLGLKLEIFEP